MSILYFLIFLIVVYRFSIDFKRTLIFYAPFKLIFHSGIFLIDSSFSLNLDLGISAVAFFLYLSKRKKNTYLNKVPKLLIVGWSGYLIGLLIHSLRPSIKPTLFLQEGVTTFLYCYILFKTITRKDDIKTLVKGFMIVSIVLFVDATIDVLTGVNIIARIEESQAGSRFWHSENVIARAGMARSTSFMPHSLTMGSLAALLWGFIYLMTARWNIKVNKKLFYITLACLAICVVYSNSRSSLIAFIILLPILIDLKSISPARTFLILAGFILLIYVFYDYFSWMYDSIANENKMNVQGSTSELRQTQFEVALYYMLKNPFLGNGNTFQILNFEDQSSIMGMESVWFPIMMQQGVVGLVTYIFLLATTIIFYIKNRMEIQVFYVISWIAIITLSSQIGLSLYLFVLLPLMSYKAKQLKN